MNSRERVECALNHRQPDRVPVDFGSSPVTGVSASAVHKLRVGLGLQKPGQRVKVIEPYQMLGEVEDDLADAMGVDCTGLGARKNLFGFENRDWKPWELADGTPLWVPSAFNTVPEANGDILMYPEGDRRAAPSGHMPAGGFYFDTIVRQPPIDDDHLNVADNLEEFTPVSDDELRYYESESARLAATGRAIVGNFGGTSFGDIALVPAPFLRNPKGIRDVAEWYMSGLTRKSYIQELFAHQAEIALANLERIRQAIGNRLSVIFVSGTDFGTQRAQFISTETYRSLYLPVHKKINGWVHQHTAWKTFLHTCGAIEPLIPHFIEAGFDILNPVQTTAAGMEARQLKNKYGEHITFWGGGAEAQGVLSWGSPEEVKRQVRERIALFGAGGGFIFNAIHNVQATTPTANLLAMVETLQDARRNTTQY